MSWQWCKMTLWPWGRCYCVGWGPRGPRPFSFDAKQLSCPIMNYYDSYLPSLPCPIKAGWKTTGHHGNSAESVATPWKSDTHIWLPTVKTTPYTLQVLCEVLPSRCKYIWPGTYFVWWCSLPGHIFTGTGLHGNWLFGFHNFKVKLAVCLALCLWLFPLLLGTGGEQGKKTH